MIRTSAHTQFTQFPLGICRIMVLFGFCTAKNVFRFSCLYYYVSLIPRQCGFSTVISFSHTHTHKRALSLDLSKCCNCAAIVFTFFKFTFTFLTPIFISSNTLYSLVQSKKKKNKRQTTTFCFLRFVVFTCTHRC